MSICRGQKIRGPNPLNHRLAPQSYVRKLELSAFNLDGLVVRGSRPKTRFDVREIAYFEGLGVPSSAKLHPSNATIPAKPGCAAAYPALGPVNGEEGNGVLAGFDCADGSLDHLADVRSR